MNILKLYNKFQKYPLGNKLFSKAITFKAPYFSTINPLVEDLEKGKCVISIKDRKSVRNHIGSVHAIAMCNLAELCAGLAIDASLDKSKRWIPKGMSVEYLKIAKGSLQGVALVEASDLEVGDNQITVNVTNAKDEIVFRAVINMYVSLKK
jgi:acyl-coenzyme A thioesterase PaaI-like protein